MHQLQLYSWRKESPYTCLTRFVTFESLLFFLLFFSTFFLHIFFIPSLTVQFCPWSHWPLMDIEHLWTLTTYGHWIPQRGVKAIHLAATRGNIEVLKNVLTRGENVDVKTNVSFHFFFTFSLSLFACVSFHFLSLVSIRTRIMGSNFSPSLMIRDTCWNWYTLFFVHFILSFSSLVSFILSFHLFFHFFPIRKHNRVISKKKLLFLDKKKMFVTCLNQKHITGHHIPSPLNHKYWSLVQKLITKSCNSVPEIGGTASYAELQDFVVSFCTDH